MGGSLPSRALSAPYDMGNPLNLYFSWFVCDLAIMASAPSDSDATHPPPSTPLLPDDLEWEEWDAATSPLSFSSHCLAGSFAGVAEHTLLYPLGALMTTLRYVRCSECSYLSYFQSY